MPSTTAAERAAQKARAAQVPLDQTRRDLLATATVLRERGLCRERYRDYETGELCSVAAVYEAVCPGFWALGLDSPSHMDPAREDRAVAVIETMSKFIGDLWPGSGQPRVIRWSDADGRTAESAAVGFEAAAAVLR